MALSAKTIQRDVAGVHEVTHVVLLIDVDQDIPVSPADGSEYSWTAATVPFLVQITRPGSNQYVRESIDSTIERTAIPIMSLFLVA